MAPERQSWDSRGLAFQSLHVSPWWFSGSNPLFQPHILLTSSVSTSPTHYDSATQCSSAFANIPCVSEEHGISTILGHTTWGCLEHSGPAAWVFAHIIFSNFHILSGLRSNAISSMKTVLLSSTWIPSSYSVPKAPLSLLLQCVHHILSFISLIVIHVFLLHWILSSLKARVNSCLQRAHSMTYGQTDHFRYGSSAHGVFAQPTHTCISNSQRSTSACYSQDSLLGNGALVYFRNYFYKLSFLIFYLVVP